MSEPDAITKKVMKIFEDYQYDDGVLISEQSRLKRDLDMDSLDEVEAIMTVEAEFHIEISDAEADKLKTVGDVVEFVKRKRDA